MPLQNRVNPFGEIRAVPERGMLMGNRGCLHDQQRQIVRTHTSHTGWVTCLTSFNNRRRSLMTPGLYTELFFLDEATALAAGHRPCGECRRDDYNRFKVLFEASNLDRGLTTGFSGRGLMAREMDRLLQADRLLPGRIQRTFQAEWSDLPSGAMFTLPTRQQAWLKWQSENYLWSFGGYQPDRDQGLTGEVTVITPQCLVRVLAGGYVPRVALES